jgi:hypothetical protein
VAALGIGATFAAAFTTALARIDPGYECVAFAASPPSCT